MFFDSTQWENDKEANSNRPYQRCTYTVMDTISDPNITFDKDGVCNYYYEYNLGSNKTLLNREDLEVKLLSIVNEIKEKGVGKRYDCITGISGGVDSTYLVYLAKKLGLKPLIVHFDNGWNSETAVKNIENIIERTGFDLYTLVVDWEEFRDLQLSYFKANVVDIEALTDHAISGTLLKLAKEEGIKYILSGNNFVTESILPKHWIFNKNDSVNIKSIHKSYGKIDIKTYPLFSIQKRKMYSDIYGIKTIELLNFIPYNLDEVKTIIKEELSWQDYGGKHFESIFTRFYQGYILPKKFGIDKRKAHLSTLICSGQITREEALDKLKLPIYDDSQLATDKNFVLKKLGMNEGEFENYINNSRVEHTKFNYDRGIFNKYPLLRPLKGLYSKIKK